VLCTASAAGLQRAMTAEYWPLNFLIKCVTCSGQFAVLATTNI